MKHTSKNLSATLVTLSILSGIAIMGISSLVNSPVFAKSTKVTICHATSSETNPYNTIVVSENAISGHFENNGTPKSGHEDDLLFLYETECPGPVVTTITPTGTPAPTSTPVFTPTVSVDEPTVTPTVTRGEENPTPTDAPSATITPTPTETSVGGASNETGTSTIAGTSASAPSSSTPGTVLGASTAKLPNTGGFYDLISLLMTSGGSMLMAGSIVSYAKNKENN